MSRFVSKSLRLACRSWMDPNSQSLSKYLKARNMKEMIGTQLRFMSSDRITDPDDLTPPIPTYTAKTGETTELKRARLLYQSRKRGMLENGLLLGTFAGKYLDTFTDTQLDTYDNLINKPTNDWEIYYWVTGVKATPSEYVSDVMDLLINHSRNEEKESRITQPDLY